MAVLLAVAAAAPQDLRSVARLQLRRYTTTLFFDTPIARRLQRFMGLLPVAPAGAAACLSASPCLWELSKRPMQTCCFCRQMLLLVGAW